MIFDDEDEEEIFESTEFDGHIPGLVCDQCGNESVFYDGDQYECSCCGMIWIDDSDIGEYIPDESEIHYKLQKQIEQGERKLFSQKITRKNLCDLFSPNYKFFRDMEFYSSEEPAPEISYPYQLSEALKTQISYDALKALPAPDGVTAEEKEKYFYGFMQDFMSSMDNLPYNPRKEDWADFLNTSVDEVEKFFPKDGISLDNFIDPQWVINNFSAVFSKSIRELDEGLWDMINDYSMNMNDCFYAYFVEREQPYVRLMDSHLSAEVNVAKRFVEAFQTKKEEFINNAKNNNMTVIETIMQFVDYAFEGSGFISE